MPHQVATCSALQCALRLLELCRYAGLVRHSGRCIGGLRPRDIVVTNGRLLRRPAGVRDRMRHRAALRRHLRVGHDNCCHVLGVPLSTVGRLLVAWGGDEAAQFLTESVQEAVDQWSQGGWELLTPYDVLKYEIGRRLTLEPPADLVLLQQELSQMPSTPSKSAASRRAFTWLRKRAASAPSTMR